MKAQVCFSRTAVLKVHPGAPKTFWEVYKVKTVFVIMLRCYFPFSLSYPLEKHSGFFQRLSVMRYHNSLNAEAYVKIHLSSIKPGIKERCEITPLFSINLGLEIIAIFYKNFIYINLLWAC